MADHRHAILIVDDHDDLRDALAFLLDAHGYEADSAALGVDALAMLGLGYRPCLILLDVRMPDMDGWDVWTTLQEQPKFADIPVLVMSGDRDVVLAHDRGVAGMLAKPVPPHELIEAVEKHARCWSEPALPDYDTRRFN
jgi:CheY-like chemotaxis protein